MVEKIARREKHSGEVEMSGREFEKRGVDSVKVG